MRVDVRASPAPAPPYANFFSSPVSSRPNLSSCRSLRFRSFFLSFVLLPVVVGRGFARAPFGLAGFPLHRDDRAQSEALFQESGDDDFDRVAAKHAPGQAEIFGAHGALEFVREARDRGPPRGRLEARASAGSSPSTGKIWYVSRSMSQVTDVLRRNEADGRARASGAPCAPGAMDVVLGRLGEIGVDDVREMRDVDAARGHVGGDRSAARRRGSLA